MRVRFAPSPTGELHIGGARTALYNYLIAKKTNGQFILRLEDTDQERYVKGSEQRLLDDLAWLGLSWDEGPDKGGDYGPYIQSQKLSIYQKYIKKLLTDDKAYYCFCSQDRLVALREQQTISDQPSKYDRYCLRLSVAEATEKVKKGEKYVIRLKVPVGSTNFTDSIHGQITINNQTIDDQVLIKSDGFPTYHLACVIDDHLMKITDVIRGEEWLPSVAKHVLLYQAFGWTTPTWTHLPNVLNQQRAKLSKRKDGEAVWLSTYRKLGYLPEAIVNFLALLGWHPQDNRELFTMKELIQEFDLTRVQKAGAIFDLTKLQWFNAQYIKKLDTVVLDKLLKDFYPSTKFNTLPLTQILQSRLVTLAEAKTTAEFFFVDKVLLTKDILIPKDSSITDTIKALTLTQQTLKQLTDWTITALQHTLTTLITEQNLTRRQILWPIRVALTGQEKSPDVFEVLWALGKNRCLTRLEQALDTLS